MVERSCLENRRGASLRGFESHPLRHFLLILSALLVAACGPIMVQRDHPEPRYVHLALPGVQEELQVADLTGSVVSAEIDPRPPEGGVDESELGSVPDRLNALVIGWPGGCEQRVDIAIEPASEPGARASITLKILLAVVPCPVDIKRRVIVVFNQPVRALDYNFDVVQ